MRVLMTGGTGHIGKSTTERLLQNGWDVRIIDLVPKVEIAGAEYMQCNILDYDDLLKAMQGCDAVIHLAAIRSPNLAAGHQVFQVNASGTFNVFEAASNLGIKRVVQASSINAIGCFYNTAGEIAPQYFPIDEAHPHYTSDPYSFSKEVIEDIGAYYWRRDGISSIALRFPGVYTRGFDSNEGFIQRKEAVRQLLDDLISQPEAEQRAIIADVQRRVMEFRNQRPYEYKDGQSQWPRSNLFDEPLFRLYAGERFNYWAFIDERDAAQSLEKGLTADYEGAHPLFANGSCNVQGYDSKAIIRLFYPDITEFKSDLSGSASLISIEKARNLIGFEPEYPA